MLGWSLDGCLMTFYGVLHQFGSMFDEFLTTNLQTKRAADHETFYSQNFKSQNARPRTSKNHQEPPRTNTELGTQTSQNGISHNTANRKKTHSSKRPAIRGQLPATPLGAPLVAILVGAQWSQTRRFENMPRTDKNQKLTNADSQIPYFELFPTQRSQTRQAYKTYRGRRCSPSVGSR